MTKEKNIILSHEPAMEIGTWRLLYKLFIDELSLNSICEVGCGHPGFLNSLDVKEKIAVDYGEYFKKDYLKNGISFLNLDLDNDSLDAGNLKLDSVVCSDVFEHLLSPDKTLRFCYDLLKKEGIFFSHVPNEFNIRRLIKVALLNSSSVFFHEGEEHSNPHLRRFTKHGYLKFLKREFKYNLYISDCMYVGVKSLLYKFNFPIPYGFQFGPTFISTNDENTFLKLEEVKKRINYNK
ncbi:MAG: hypothetical protein CMC84_07875 [Flavobacteriaceae bacterium]|nr:hypothetical protein [Flavobacteriaceae bacterium]|tara:strand:- start:527 stop:1234 length:708 start_codon:yes stop_codon:yes gene_type:complete